MSKRSFSRISFQAPVYINYSGKTYSGEIENICHGGMLLKTDADIPNGGIVQVAVNYYDGSSNLSVAITGKVVRETSEGFGLQSTHIDAHLLIHFEDMIARSEGNEEKLFTDFIEYVTSQKELNLI